MYFKGEAFTLNFTEIGVPLLPTLHINKALVG